MIKTMLIVDGNETNLEILRIIFQEEYMILEAGSGRKALEIIECCNGNIDIVLLDTFIQDINGFELLKRFREMNCFMDIPVVVISSSTDYKDQVEAFKYGANDFISKPFIPELVSSRVNNVMAARQRIRIMEYETERLKVKLRFDDMTNLLNKTTVELMITDTLQREAGRKHAMLVIDIDNFKAVNDLEGHLTGDYTIRVVANTISNIFRKTDIVGRIGGDEFVVLIVNIPSMDIVRRKARELTRIMKYKPDISIPENITLSVGYAESTPDTKCYNDLFVCADEALYSAKRSGGARAQEFGAELFDPCADGAMAALLIGRNRGVCSVINALVPQCLRLIEVLDISDVEKIPKNDISCIVIVYVDVSDMMESTIKIWKKVESFSFMSFIPIIAICGEGNLSQYREALMYRVKDIFSAPIDRDAFKRRTVRMIGGIDDDTCYDDDCCFA